MFTFTLLIKTKAIIKYADFNSQGLIKNTLKEFSFWSISYWISVTMRGGYGLYGNPPPGGIGDVLDSLTVASACSINKKIYHKTVKPTIVSGFFLELET